VQLPSDFALNVAEIEKAVTEDTRIMSICNPHSPSGTLYSRETLLELVEFCQKKASSSAWTRITSSSRREGEEVTLAGYVKKYDELFVIRSVTKFYGMPGIRFGYGLAAESLVDTLQTVKLPWSINGLAGVAVMAALKTKNSSKNETHNHKEKSAVCQDAHRNRRAAGFPSVTNFLLVKIISGKLTSTALRKSWRGKACSYETAAPSSV